MSTAAAAQITVRHWIARLVAMGHVAAGVRLDYPMTKLVGIFRIAEHAVISAIALDMKDGLRGLGDREILRAVNFLELTLQHVRSLLSFASECAIVITLRHIILDSYVGARQSVVVQVFIS